MGTVQRTRRAHIKNYGQQVMCVRTLEGFVRKSTWQVADVRKTTCVRISHHPSLACSGGYIMNRKKKEKSVLRKEGNMYVLDSCAKVPSGATAPRI